MAEMIPPEIDPTTKSGAERRLFMRLQTELSREWTVLHSLNIKDHPTQPWGEVDFVLIGPDGVYCLEVKGGRVRRVSGEWQYLDRDDRVFSDYRGPFRQVQEATQALTKFIKSRRPHLTHVPVMSGVAVPDTVIEGDGPDIISEIVYDLESLDRPFLDYLKRVSAYWKPILEKKSGVEFRRLTTAERNEIVQLLRPDFDFRVTLRPLIREATRELIRFTREQFRVFEGLRANKRVVVIGSAGTGKTFLAVEEAKRWSRAGARVFLTCFNRNLAQYLRRVLEGYDVHVENFHAFVVRMVRESGKESELPRASQEEMFRAFYPEACWLALVESVDFEPYDVLIIDEAQDLLLDGYMNVFDVLLKDGLEKGQWRVFLDLNQNLFQATGTRPWSRIRENATRFELSTNCRNTKNIALTVTAVSGVDFVRTINVAGPEVKVRFVSGPDEELREVSKSINRLLSEKIDPADIVVLGHKRLERSSLAKGLLNVPYSLYDMESSGAPSGLRYATVRSFKGLEADAILMTGVDDLESKERLLELYVGLSRARAYLELYVYDSAKPGYDARYEEFGRKIAQLGPDDYQEFFGSSCRGPSSILPGVSC